MCRRRVQRVSALAGRMSRLERTPPCTRPRLCLWCGHLGWHAVQSAPQSGQRARQAGNAPACILVSSECPVASYSSTKSTSLFRGFVLSLRQCRSFVMPHGSTRRIHTAETSHLSPGGPACSNLDPDRGGKVGRCGAHDALLRVGARGVAPEVQRGAVRGAQGRQQQRHRGRLAMHLRGAARTRRGCWGAARLGGGGRVEAPGRRARQQ